MVLKKYYNHYYPASLANQRALSACCRQGVLIFMVAETKKKRQLGRSFLFGPETCRPKFTCTLLPLTPAAASLPQPRRRLSPADASQPPFSLSPAALSLRRRRAQEKAEGRRSGFVGGGPSWDPGLRRPVPPEQQRRMGSSSRDSWRLGQPSSASSFRCGPLLSLWRLLVYSGNWCGYLLLVQIYLCLWIWKARAWLCCRLFS
jgi:hypothetical protein